MPQRAYRHLLMGVLAAWIACSSGCSGAEANQGLPGATATGSSTTSGTAGGSTSSGTGGTGGNGGGTSAAADLARRLGRTPHLLIGMGNDLVEPHEMDGAYTLGVTFDLHDAYLVAGSFPWTKWNTDEQGDGAFVTNLAKIAKDKG